jgi:hypothetical protein
VNTINRQYKKTIKKIVKFNYIFKAQLAQIENLYNIANCRFIDKRLISNLELRAALSQKNLQDIKRKNNISDQTFNKATGKA